ncbi:MAG: hypothetical protein J6S91_07740 [Treponema sp.]|nr:hypothetical protein [Treponema sp.]
MKRLLEMISLVFCALLMSCSNGISDKTGDINFSFNAADFIRGSIEGDTTGISEYTFLVQVKGSRNYYDYQIQTVRVENTEINAGGGQQINPLPGGNTVIGVYDPYGDYINENELSFTFGYVPANQKYTVMLDMFAKQDDKNYLVMTGKSRDVEVKRGQPATVELNMDGANELSPLYIKVEYEDGNFDLISNYHLPPYGTSTSVGGTVYKKYGKLWYQQDDNHPVKPMKSIGYALDSNSNFPESSYKYSIPYGMANLNGYTTDNIPLYKDFTFDGDRCPLEDFLLNYRDFTAGYAFHEVEEDLKFGSLTSGYPAKISKGNFSFIECAPAFTFKSEDEVVSGHIGDKPMSFINTPYQDGKKHAFLKYKDISSLLNFTGDETHKLIGSSVVLVLTLKGNPSLPSNELFYKMLNDELTTQDSGNIDGGALFSFSHNIQFNSGERKIIIPLNQIQESKTKLLLFMRNDNNRSSLTCYFDIDYYIFPSSMSAFVFNIKPQESGYRYELDESISEIWENSNLVESNSSYKADFSGNFCKFNLSDKKFTPVSVKVNAELYYFAERYTPFTSGGDGVNGNVKSFTTQIPNTFDDDAKTYILKFPSINRPDNGTGNKFQCYTDCPDTNQLLVVRDYNLAFETDSN